MNKQQFMKAFGYRTESLTNLLTNGNFDGTTGWGSNGTTFSVSGNEATMLADTQYDTVYRIDVPITNTHKYYYCGWIKSDSAQTGILFGNNAGSLAFAYSAGSGDYEFVSNIYTAINTTDYARMDALCDLRPSGWTTLKAKYISIIDITSAFGAGYEPNKAQMDWLMQQFTNRWLDGTQNALYGW